MVLYTFQKNLAAYIAWVLLFKPSHVFLSLHFVVEVKQKRHFSLIYLLDISEVIFSVIILNSGFRFPVFGFRIPDSGFRFPVSGFWIPVSWF